MRGYALPEEPMTDNSTRPPTVADEQRSRDAVPEDGAEVAAMAADTGTRAEPRRWVGPLVASGLAMVAAAIAGLVLTGMQDNAIYSKPVDQLLASKAKFVGRPVRAEGNLIHGSLVKREQPCEYRFSITKNGAELPVRFAQCVVPDTFRDVPDLDVGVTVEGELQNDDTFEATSVLAKCPSKYEMKQRKDKGEQMPHGSLAAAGPAAPEVQ
jgi:cytochrome c-type biogenesis protein CcmE